MQHEAACRAESGSTACVLEGAAKPDVVGKWICTFSSHFKGEKINGFNGHA